MQLGRDILFLQTEVEAFYFEVYMDPWKKFLIKINSQTPVCQRGFELFFALPLSASLFAMIIGKINYLAFQVRPVE